LDRFQSSLGGIGIRSFGPLAGKSEPVRLRLRTSTFFDIGEKSSSQGSWLVSRPP